MGETAGKADKTFKIPVVVPIPEAGKFCPADMQRIGGINATGWHTAMIWAILSTYKINGEVVMSIQEQIQEFLSAAVFGVVGASSNRQKFGNRVLRCYLLNGKQAIPVNPNEAEIEGIACVKSVEELSPEVKSISMITPPAVTEQLVPRAIAHGIENIWMQPGAESPAALALCREKGINVIADGSCLLVVLGFHDH